MYIGLNSLIPCKLNIVFAKYTDHVYNVLELEKGLSTTSLNFIPNTVMSLRRIFPYIYIIFSYLIYSKNNKSFLLFLRNYEIYVIVLKVYKLRNLVG